MKRLYRLLLASLIIILTLYGCSERTDPDRPDIVIIGIPGDADTFNPIFATGITASQIIDLIYPSLVHSDFDPEEGVISYYPSLSKSWEHHNDNQHITFDLRTDAVWEDGTSITARDVYVTYKLYGNPEIGSVRQDALENFLKNEDGTPDIERSIEIVNDSTIIFKFEAAYTGQLFDAGLPILPAHIFENIPNDELRTHPVNRQPVGAGPFRLRSWTPQQSIVLESNDLSVLPHPGKLSRLIFQVIPDYQSRISQLEAGEIDMMDDITVEDAGRIEGKRTSINIIPMPERRYYFIGWNNIDVQAFADSEGQTIQPHPIFGDPDVRTALTLAINRAEMTNAFFGDYAREAVGPIPPVFRWAYDESLEPLPYDPQRAAQLLENAGWRVDDTGILHKENNRFSFTMMIPSGDHLRSMMATTIQQQLREINIEMRIEQVEGAVFLQNLIQKAYDAWIVGFMFPLELQIDNLWGSDFNTAYFNFVSFQDQRVDEILARTRVIYNTEEAAPLWMELQRIFHEKQPVTFLCWVSNIVGVHERVKGKTVDIHGFTHRAWEWYTE